jgi:hypothetical protein
MRVIIKDTAHVNSFVYKLGWKYPIQIMSRLACSAATQRIQPTFGEPAKRYHFSTYQSCNMPVVKELWNLHPYPLGRRFYSGNRMWNVSGTRARYDYWMVFKNEKDRTLALLLLGP